MAKSVDGSSGYKNPPKKSQFLKGKSGNPNGRPKGAKGFKTLLAKELKAKITIEQDGKKKRIPRSEAIAKGLINDALRGRDRPRDTVLRYAEAIEQDSHAQAMKELAADDQAILDRYFERRLAQMKMQEDSNDAD